MKRDITIIRHYQKIVDKYIKIMMRRPLKSDEYQNMYYAQAKIEEEYSKPAI